MKSELRQSLGDSKRRGLSSIFHAEGRPAIAAAFHDAACDLCKRPTEGSINPHDFAGRTHLRLTIHQRHKFGKWKDSFFNGSNGKKVGTA